ncbi:GvpL/GvpF family gas vesicle protein [Streptomyces sp. ID01-12c]|uniref:GvpL/GvpF family gas vesicle protein n=2 Tax=Streptomyces caniscabiei TaxID=2746961 RepID=A0A927QJ14_9ACTN|nr:GvpL/GvpF family gas vesicle protein [Streptomyces caniscabiei]MBD9703077.1 GvpL/GvpF family gas vesicle protein [Streptomyces caniscabiei]MBD9727590.1 GvpL/GvpF family gas vesicle protein [Streptomyces caniscabiei]MDX3513001.1 GvpL/GvpF family gas vesicle protein [Streptomyces caniscabiei]MDX3722039.1 GvpL/GvpF family gas vesicle protein [Streptomyces caniscabiei]WEO24987.1 GvpL/GvpF family gas vesicle protein [Streptomyces caniscabiei]
MSVYVYAITKAAHPLGLDDVKGVGADPTALHAVSNGELSAVVSEAPDDLSVSRRDVEAHQEVQLQLWTEGAILPLSFGFVAPDEAAVEALLQEQAETFSRRLDELTGRAEFNVKGVHDEDTLLRAVLTESARARELNDAIREGGGTYEDRLALGELVAQEVQGRQEALGEEVLAALRPYALDERLAPASQQYFVNASFLVEGEREDEFAEAGGELAEALGEGVELRLRGPLPPYSFV